MNVSFECTYCGNKWNEDLYNPSTAKNARCSKCKDRHPKYWDSKETQIDYYAGSPEFPLKSTKKDEEILAMTTNFGLL